MDNEETTTQKEYTQPVDIIVDNDTVTWDPILGAIIPKSGQSANQVVELVSGFILSSAPDGITIPVTPEGPFLPATTSDLRTVVWAVGTVFPESDISFVGDAPTMADLGLDKESNFDADGLPIVR